MRTFIASGLALASIFSFVGCGGGNGGDESGFSSALPPEDSVQIDFPTSSATARFRESLEEDTTSASCYDNSLDLATRANDRVKNVLTTLDRVTDYPPGESSDSTYMWGPKDNTDEGITEMLMVTKNDDGSYAYEFDAAPLGTEDYLPFITGTIDAGSTHDAGTGSFTVDLDAVQALEPSRDVAGSMDFVYSYDGTGARKIDVTLNDYLFGNGDVSDAQLAFDRKADRSGQLDWARGKNIYGASTLEDLAYRARWNADRTGRCDGQASGGDIDPHVITAHQCWDTTTAEVYYAQEQDGVAQDDKTRGSADACAITDVSYADGL